MEKIVAVTLVVIGILVLAAGISLLLTFPVMWAINWLFAPSLLIAVFGAAQITFWKAFVLTYVSSALFKSVNYSSK